MADRPPRVKAKPRGRPWTAATRPTNGGRPKGALGKATREIRTFAQSLLEDPAYVAALRVRLEKGTAGPIEPLLFAYGYGQPKQTLALEGTIAAVNVSRLTDADLRTALRLQRLLTDGSGD